MKCYEIKDCPFNGEDHCDSKCPPHRLRIGCWEYDWVSYYQNMPECKEKFNWRNFMTDNCPQCKVYSLYKNDIDIVLNALKKV